MRVLLCVGGGIGNVVMATPAAAALARLGFEVTMYLQPEAVQAAELLRGWDVLQRVITGPPPAPTSFAEATEADRSLGEGGPDRFDLAVHTVWSHRRGVHPDERSPGRVDLRNMHEAEANMIPVRALGYAGPLPPAHVEVRRRHLPPRHQGHQEQRESGERQERRPTAVSCRRGDRHGHLTATDAGHGCHDAKVLGCWRGSRRSWCPWCLGGECRYRVLAPGCNPDPFWDRKRWGGWRELAERLGGAAVYLGTARDSRRWMSSRGAAGTPGSAQAALTGAVDLCGRTTLAEAAGVIAGARAVVAVDNGLAHVAAALGVPTVVLFGATSETKNRPLGPRVRLVTRPLPCRPCQMTPRWASCREWRCMGITVDEVAAAARSLSEGGRRESGRPAAPRR